MDRHPLQPLRRIDARMAGTVLCGLAGLLCAGCEIAEPALPTFTTSLTIPLGEKRIDILEIVEDEQYLVALDDGSLGFQVGGDPDTVSLDFDLGVDVPSQEVDGTLGAFALAVEAGTGFSFTLVDLYPQAALLDGLVVPVPAFDFDLASDAEDVADLRSARLAQGTLAVTIDNGLPVTVSAFEGPQRLVLEMLDPGSGVVLASLDFDPIAPGGQARRTADLAGVRLPGEVAVRLVGGSAGSDGAAQAVDAQAAIAVEAAFSDLQVVEAEAIVPAQSFGTSFTSPLPADYGVQLAVIEEGSLTLALSNGMAIPCQAVVVWPAVRDADLQPLQVTVDLPGGGEETRTISFAGHVIQAAAGEVLQEMTAEVTVTSPGSQGQYVTLTADDGVRATLGDGRIEFASVTGTVPDLSYDLDPVEQTIELPDELDGLQLCRASLVLAITTTAGVPATAELDLVGINQDGARRTLQVQEALQASDDGRAATTTIVLDETNSGIVAFLNHLPTTIALGGSVTVGGDGGLGTVRRGDVAVIEWEIASPVEVVIESSRLYSEPEALDLDRDIRERIADHGGAAAVSLEILNHLPVGVQAHLALDPDPDALKTSPLLVIGPVGVVAGEVADPDGTVSDPVVSRPQVVLTAEQTRLLGTAGLYSLLEVTLPSTEGRPVRVLTTDYITVQGLVSLDIEVHDDR